MRRRQLKKLVKANVRKRGPWEQAHSRGSKKLVRRWKTMCRYWSGGGAAFEQRRVMSMKLRAFEAQLVLLKTGEISPTEIWAEMAVLASEWAGETKNLMATVAAAADA